MAVSAERNAQLPQYVENRHINHIPAADLRKRLSYVSGDLGFFRDDCAA
jgi:hypothetical protein